ncbi:MAG: class I SAM-dependent methyltransferase [Fusobacteria bacterium]|nr:class I SAM-dependent methyltransferase [Fusobacteriota bacterium]
MSFARVYDNFMKYVDYDEWYNYIILNLEKLDKNIENVLELGAGTGEFLIRFAKKYPNIIGIDINNEMLSLSKEKITKNNIKNIELIHEDMLNLQTNCENDLVYAFFDVINYLKSIAELETLLKKVGENLKSGGIFFFDVATPNLMKEMFPNGVFYDNRDDMTIFWEHYHNKKDKIEEISVTFFVLNDDGKYSRIDEYYEKKIFTNLELKKAIDKNNFKILKIIKNNEFAGERLFYIIEKI